MSRKVRVGILFGGRSAEHEVSLQSARNVIEAIDRDKYEPLLIGIDKQGRWHLSDEGKFLQKADDPREIRLKRAESSVSLAPWSEEGRLMASGDGEGPPAVDVIFPILHGPMGEDGTVQGLLRLANLPFVGAGVLGSALGMDKDVMKRILRDAGIPIGRYFAFRHSQAGNIDFEALGRELGLPLFIKPANMGSSVGVSRVEDREAFEAAVREAFRYDTKILIEEFIPGREIECSVLGNEDPIASLPGEIVPQHEFYSYEAKYLDENGALLKIPAQLSPVLTEAVRDLAVRAFQALCCEGMARIDCFLTRGDRFVVNEINTIPGFTRISMYPKLWEASGISYAELIDRLIELAIERHQRESRLETSFTD